MKLVVITPTLGVSPWLPATIASVAGIVPWAEHWLIAPRERADELARRFSNVKITAEPDGGRGMYAAINAGAGAAGDWDLLTYLNDDDLLLPEFAKSVEGAAQHGNTSWIGYGRVRLIDTQGRRLGAIPVSPRPELNRALYAQRIEPVYQHGTVISRRAWEALGGFDTTFRLSGDSEFLARACVQGVPFRRWRGGEVAAFRLRAGQMTKDRAAMVAERAEVDAKLNLLGASSARERRYARIWFRLMNLPVYAERILRHGFISFDQLLERAD